MKNLFVVLLLFLASLSSMSLQAGEKGTTFVVAADGSGDFKHIQAAIDATKAFPDAPIRIFIKNGIYTEKVRVYSWNTNLSLIGENKDSVIVTYSDYFDKIALGRNSTFHTYTLKVEASDFYMENITVENGAGPVGQAVALHVEGDRCSFVNCRFLGHQDTVYAAGEGARQYFKHCFISGTTDFIFGASTALFDACEIHSLSNSYITAASTPERASYGYWFRACCFTAAEGVSKVYLGRPWRDHAWVLVSGSTLGAHIAAEGWSNWSGTQRDRTARYFEYNNKGAGATACERVPWSQQLTPEAAAELCPEVFFSSGTSTWLPTAHEDQQPLCQLK